MSIRVETTQEDGELYREVRIVRHVEADARQGLVHRWRRWPSHALDLILSSGEFFGVLLGVFAYFAFAAREAAGIPGWVILLLVAASPLTLLGFNRLNALRRRWRDARQEHSAREVTIRSDALVVDGHSFSFDAIERVRVVEERAPSPAGGGRVEVRYRVEADVGDEVHSVFDGLRAHELSTVTESFHESGHSIELPQG